LGAEELPSGEDADSPRFNGYQLLAHLLYTKHELLDTDIIEIVFEWIGMSHHLNDDKTITKRTRDRERGRERRNKEKQDDRREQHPKQEDSRATIGDVRTRESGGRGVLGNSLVFRHILLELHLWNNSVGMLQMLLQHIAGLISADNIHHKYNLYRCVTEFSSKFC
jgi:hypothetical protein